MKKLSLSIQAITSNRPPHSDIIEIIIYSLEKFNFGDYFRSLDTKSLDAISKEMIKEKPNSYIYTKALAESMIMEKFRSLPIAIARPSIVTEAVKEPAPGNSINSRRDQ